MLDKVSRSFLLRRSRDKSRSARSSGSSLLGVVASVATAAPVAGFAASPFSTDRGLLPFDWWPVNGRKGQTIFTFSVACWLQKAANVGGWGRKNERVMLLLWSQLAKLYLLGRRIKEELGFTLYLCNPSNL